MKHCGGEVQGELLAASRLWRTLCPTIEIESLRPLGSGQDHVAFAVNEQYVLRHQDAGAGGVPPSREHEVLLLASRRSTIPVPEVLATDDDLGAIVTRMMHGTPLLASVVAQPLLLADQLLSFVDRLHATPLTETEGIVDDDPYPPTEALAEAAATVAVVAPVLDLAKRSRLRRFLATTPPPDTDRRCLCHNDLGAEHLVVDVSTSSITGIIDWTDAATTDPARDLARLQRDLPDTVYRRLIGLYPHRDDEIADRARFLARCYLLEDIAFGVGAGRREYVDHALRRFDHVFEQ